MADDSRIEHPIHRASHGGGPTVQDVRVDHRGADVTVSEELWTVRTSWPYSRRCVARECRRCGARRASRSRRAGRRPSRRAAERTRAGDAGAAVQCRGPRGCVCRGRAIATPTLDPRSGTCAASGVGARPSPPRGRGSRRCCARTASTCRARSAVTAAGSIVTPGDIGLLGAGTVRRARRAARTRSRRRGLGAAGGSPSWTARASRCLAAKAYAVGRRGRRRIVRAASFRRQELTIDARPAGGQERFSGGSSRTRRGSGSWGHGIRTNPSMSRRAVR